MHRYGLLGLGLIVVLSSPSAAQPVGKLVEETWDAAYLDGFKSGFFHTQVREISLNGQKIFRTTIDMNLSLRRFTETITMRMESGTDETEAVSKLLHEMPVDDVFGRGGKVGPNGRMIHDMYLLEVKKPSESKQAWDYFKVLATIPGDEAYIKPAESGCPLVK